MTYQPSPPSPTPGLSGSAEPRSSRRWLVGAGTAALVASLLIGLGTGFGLRRATAAGPTSSTVAPNPPAGVLPPSPAPTTRSTTPTTSPPVATPMTGEALAASGLASQSLVPIDLGTGRAGSPIALPLTPIVVLVAPTGETAYAASLSDPYVVPVDLVTRKALARIPVPQSITGLVLSADGRWLYASCGQHDFVTISTSTDRVVNTTYVPGGVGGIVLDPSGKTAYVDSSGTQVEASPDYFTGGSEITAIDLVNDTVARAWNFNGPVSVEGISPDGSVLYAAIEPDSGTPASVLYTVDVTGGTIGTGHPLSYSLNDFAVAPSWDVAYVSSSQDQLTALNLHTFALGTPIDVGQDPATIVFSTDGRYLAVATFAGVVVVDLASGAAYTPIPLPGSGSGLGSTDHGAIGLALVPQK
jgi:DNA-binding beta-propeller fold protein YncE